MLYGLLKILSRITIFSYFKKLEITGKEHLNTKEPIIIVSNHPSTFMDPLVLAVLVNFKVFFLVAAEYVGRGIQKVFFQRFLHMIPVYRPTTKPDEAHKNKHMFDYCYKHLVSKKSLLIFPEGVSVTADHLHPLKTGVARIALGAEKSVEKQLNLKILVIGLNYSNPHKFRSNLLVNITEPISVAEYIKNYEDEAEEVQVLMKDIRAKLENAVLHLDEIENSEFLKQINKLLRYFKSTNPDSVQENFLILKRLNEFLNSFAEEEKQRIQELQSKSSAFFKFIEKEKIDLRTESIHKKINSLKIWLSVIFGAPIFIAGAILNFIPYKLVGVLNAKLKLSETFFGAISLAAGMLIFSIWYLVFTLVLGFGFIGIWTLFFPFLAYSLGIYALLYANLTSTLRSVNKSMRKLKSDNTVYVDFQNQLAAIHKDLIYFQEKILAKNP